MWDYTAVIHLTEVRIELLRVHKSVLILVVRKKIESDLA